jgi:dTDP-4-amino-4,6-dideoxygalactose transaminase
VTDQASIRIPFSGVGARYTEDEKAAVLQAMDATTTLTQGSYQDRFEAAFADYIGIPHAFATSCCATALELAAILLRLNPGDEVICPAHTYCATAYPFARHGARLVWADIDPETFVVSAATLAPLITPRTKAIIVVHLYGLGADMPSIMELAQPRGIKVIEDCAQSIGATVAGKMTGCFGDISCFSFQSHKNISTLGEGGMICVKDPEWTKVLPGLRHNGHRPYPAPRDRYWVPAMVDVDFDWAGVWPHNFCLGEVQCALGLKMLSRVAAINAHRRARYVRFTEAMASCAELVFQKIPRGRVSSHHLLPFRYDAPRPVATSHDFIERMVTVHGIRPAVQYYPLNRYPLFARAGFGEANVPNTDRLFDNMVSLPFHHWMPDTDFDYMIEATTETARVLRGNL